MNLDVIKKGSATRVSSVKSDRKKTYDWLKDAILSSCKKVFTSEPALSVHSLELRSTHHSVHKDYDFTLQSNDMEIRLVLRLHHGIFSIWGDTDHIKTAKEYSATRHAYQYGYPSPFPYRFSPSEKPFGYPYLILDPGDGVPWGEAGENVRILEERAVDSIAGRLAQLHQTVPAKHPLIPKVKISQVLRHLWNRVRWLEDDRLRRCFTGCKQQAASMTRLPSVMLHGLFDIDNVLLLNHQVRSIVNWEHAAFGDPRWDVAYTSLSLQHGNDRSVANQFLARYVQHIEHSLSDINFWEGLVALRGYAQCQWLQSIGNTSIGTVMGKQSKLLEREDFYREKALRQFG